MRLGVAQHLGVAEYQPKAAIKERMIERKEETPNKQQPNKEEWQQNNTWMVKFNKEKTRA